MKDLLASIERDIEKIFKNQDLTDPQKRKRIMKLLKQYRVVEESLTDLIKGYVPIRKKRKRPTDFCDEITELFEGSFFTTLLGVTTTLQVMNIIYSKDDFSMFMVVTPQASFRL